MSISNKTLSKRLRKVECRNVTYVSDDFPVFWESARGSQVTDAEGRTYLDLTGAFAVTSLGHSHPSIRRSLIHQSSKMWHGMGDVHPNAVKVKLLEKLARLAPGRLGVSILSSSGADAVESAIKTARLFTKKRGVIAFQGAYHGLSYGTLPLTDRHESTGPFADQVADFAVHLPFPDSLRGPSAEECLDRLETFLRNNETVGAILIEPVQGRGGVRVPKASFLKEVAQIAKHSGLLLIADEIMTGFGRTGRTFAVEHSGVVPDLLCVGKAMANGFPISACIGEPDIMSAWPASDGEAIHTSTFLGNPLGCAMALASLKELEKARLAVKAESLGKWWIKELRQELGNHPSIAEVRGLGLMIGIEFVKNKKSLEPNPQETSQFVIACLRKGLIVLSGGGGRNVLTLTPPLTISKAELEAATQIFKEILYGTDPKTN